MGTIFSRRASGTRLHASYGGDGYRPEGEKEYQSLEGIEVLQQSPISYSSSLPLPFVLMHENVALLMLMLMLMTDLKEM